MAELKHPIKDAERYLDNAKKILSEKAEKEGNYYGDKKYVRMAGHTAWNGVLVALDATLDVRSKLKRGQRPDVADYRNALYAKDKKMNTIFRSAYDGLHLALGYDGNLNYKVAQAALEDGRLLVSWASKHYKPENV